MAKEINIFCEDKTKNEESSERNRIDGSETEIVCKELRTPFLENIIKESNSSLKPIHNRIKTSRTTLWYLTFIGFALNFMLRINLNIAIVDMVQRTHSTNFSNVVIDAECYNSSTVIKTQIYSNISEADLPQYITRFSLERTILKFFKIDFNENGFNWDEYQQGLILGSYYWISWLTTIPGGVLARMYGAKLIFGLTNFLGCIICSLIPIAAYIDIRVIIFLRVLQGLITGLTWPSVHEITARWIPPNERSTFMTVTIGSSVGVALFYPLFGYVIALSSWEWPFHICTLFGTLWYFAWEHFVFDSPAKHPRIHQDEKEYIEYTLGSTVHKHNKAPTPWISILTSPPVWMIFTVAFGINWATHIFVTQTPTYFKIILGWNIKVVGLLSGVPHITKMLFSYIYSSFSDYMLRNNKFTRTNVRKLAVVVSNILGGIAILVLAYSGCNTILAVIYLTLITTFSGASVSGPMASTVDISPNFASVVAGINGVIIILPGFVSAFIVGILTVDNQTLQQWQYVFLITFLIQFISGVLFLIFGSSELQAWNEPKLNKNKSIPLMNVVEQREEYTDDRNVSINKQ